MILVARVVLVIFLKEVTRLHPEGKEEFNEARDHCRALLALCFKDQDDHSADR
jgi:hypothetical protein